MLTSLLSSLLLLAPVALALPSYPSLPVYKLQNILYNSSYTYYTPSHYATGTGLVSFDLINTLVPQTTIHCGAESHREFSWFYGEIIYTCDPVPDYPIGTANFTFSSSGAITISQTWSDDTS
ncbi:hypothetical protein FKW77_006467 [Venturia effusa]|uniref:AA1-like domain-containing protein n=1 Tax=Venturia effusa TaxID=50376 RepID=A0A517L1H1_9PEZI|nr:hypothetical protein FKW77_006467 [Venturia effusa]